MSAELEELVQDFYDYFINLYHKEGGHKVGEAMLAFEAIGTSLTPEMFLLGNGEFSPELAIEQFSSIANNVPMLEDTTIMGNSSMTVDGQYEVLVFSARSLAGTGPEADLFSRFHSGALQQFDMSKRHNLLSTGKIYRPAVATPPDWCAPNSHAGWSNKAFTKKQGANSGSGVVVRPPRPRVTLPHWMLRVLDADMAPALESPKALDRVLPQLKLRQPTIGPMPAGVMKHTLTLASQSAVAQLPSEQVTAASARLAPAPGAETVMAGQAVGLMRRPLTIPSPIGTKVPLRPGGILTIPRPDVLAAKIGLLNNTATSHEVTSESLHLAFEFCLLEISRPWVSGELFSLKNWYMPGYREGEMASGTGTKAQPLEFLPAAAIVVRNLSIKAAWSQENKKALKTALAFGPFSLHGSDYKEETGELTQKGMQIVGWILEPVPKLPPASDPGLVAAAGTAPGS